MWLSIHYTIKKKTIVCRVVGGATAAVNNGQAECLEDKILGRCFWVVKCGVTTDGWASLVLCYDHINSIIRNTQLFHNSATIAFYFNYT